MKYPIQKLDYNALARAANPPSGGVPECVADWLYDTQTYTDNTSTELTFFGAAQSDRSLSNMGSGGQLEDPQFFIVQCIYVDCMNNAAGTPYLTSTTAAAQNVGAVDDVGKLILSGRGRLTLTVSDKRYGPWPLSAFRGTGAALGFGWGTTTAEETVQYAHNALGDGGFIGGTIIIPPKVGFNIVLTWPAAVDLTADYRIRVTMQGPRYRRVS